MHCEFRLRFLCLFITINFCNDGLMFVAFDDENYAYECYFLMVYNLFDIENVNDYKYSHIF